MSTNNSTIPKCLVNVPLSGVWISKEIHSNNTSEKFHCHFGNSSICNIQQLLSLKPESCKIISKQHQKRCKVCLGLLKNSKKHTEIKNHNEKLTSLYQQEVITPEQAITNFITDPENRPVKYSKIKKIFQDNFPKFSFEDTISFMSVTCQILLQDDNVLSIVECEILS